MTQMSLKKSFIVLACLFAVIMATATSTCTNITHVFVQNIAETALAAQGEIYSREPLRSSSLVRTASESLDEAAGAGQEKLEDSLPCISRSDILPGNQLHIFVLLFMQSCFTDCSHGQIGSLVKNINIAVYAGPLWISLRKLRL